MTSCVAIRILATYYQRRPLSAPTMAPRGQILPMLHPDVVLWGDKGSGFRSTLVVIWGTLIVQCYTLTRLSTHLCPWTDCIMLRSSLGHPGPSIFPNPPFKISFKVAADSVLICWISCSTFSRCGPYDGGMTQFYMESLLISEEGSCPTDLGSAVCSYLLLIS